MRPWLNSGIRACPAEAGRVIIDTTLWVSSFLVLGGIAGWIASIIMGTDQSQGIVGNIIVGIVGALIGGLVFNIFGDVGVTGFNLYSLLVATIGAVVGFWLMQAIRSA